MNIVNSLKKIVSVGSVDPVRDDKQIFTVLLVGERSGVAISAIISGVAFAAWGWSFASDLWDNFYFKAIVASVILIASTYFTDVAIKFIFQKGAYDFFLFWKFEWIKDFRKNWHQRSMQFIGWAGLIAVGGAMFLVDFLSVDAVKTAVGDMVRQDTLINQTAVVAQVDGQEAARITATVGAIEYAKADLKLFDEQIEKERRRIASGYDKGIKLYESKNAWFFEKRLNRDFANSKRLKELNDQIAETRQNLAAPNKQRVKDIAARSDRVKETNATISAINTATLAENTQRKDGSKNMTMYLGVGAKGIAIVIRILLVALFLAYANNDANKDGKVDHADVDEAAKQGFRPA